MKRANRFISVIMSTVLALSLFIPILAAPDSGDGTAVYRNHTYRRIDTSFTWQEAKEYCESLGGYLATVTSYGEQLAVQRAVEGGSKYQYWLGGTDEGSEGSWTWVTGEDWKYVYDNARLDNFKDNEHYLQIQRVPGSNSQELSFGWNDACNTNTIEGEEDYYSKEHVGLVCEFGAEPLDDDGVAEYLGHTYMRIDEPLSWKQAKTRCEELGGYLATVTSSGEQDFLRHLIHGGTQAQYWLGGTREGHYASWEWVTGEIFDYWAQTISFETNDNGEDFLQMQRHNWGDFSKAGRWNNANNENLIVGEESFYSTDMVGYICEVGTSEMPTENNSTEPIVYIIGRTGIYTADGQPTIVENSSFVTDIVENNTDALKDAVLKNKWDAYCDILYDQISARYADYRLNEQGEVDNGTGVRFSWDASNIPCRQWDMFTYKFEYDARLDPCVIADDLNNYIEAIKETTGYDKIHLVSRCLGCNIASAYLTEYGWDSVDTNVFFASAAKGYAFVGEMFAGKFDFSSSAIARYEDETYTGDPGDSEEYVELIKSIIELADEKGILSLGTLTADLVFQRVSENIVPRLIAATYGTSPGYWAMVNDENYEDAKAYIFGDEASTTYAELIKKIDNYHYNVQNALESTLLNMSEDGVKINVLCKYGFQVSPFIESSDEVGDNRIEISKQSMGATTSKINRTFSLVYMKKAEKNGTAKYISPDRQIDGSTALFPDSTWYIKNILHNPFHDCFNPLLMQLCYSEEQMTVNSDERWPQYLYYDDTNGSCIPLTEENMESTTVSTKYTTNIFTAYFRFIKAFFEYVISLLKAQGLT